MELVADFLRLATTLVLNVESKEGGLTFHQTVSLVSVQVGEAEGDDSQIRGINFEHDAVVERIVGVFHL